MKFKKIHHTVALGLLAAALVSVFSACSLASTSGSLRFSAPQSRELVLADVVEWKISGTGPSFGEFTVQFTDSSQDIIVTDLETGVWTITVQGFATGDDMIYSKTDSIDVFAGENALTITLDVLVQSISLSKATGSLSLAATESLVATIEPPNATNMELVWSSSNDAIATVDGNGVVTAVALGTATITATSAENNAKFAVFNLTVGTPLVLRWDFEDDTEPLKDVVTQVGLSGTGSFNVWPGDGYNSDKGLFISEAGYGTIPANPYKDRSGPWAISLWFMRTDSDPSSALLSSALGQSIFVTNTGVLGIRHENGTTESFGNTDIPLVINEWAHVLVASTGTEVQLFINGQKYGAVIPSAFNLPLDALGARIDPTPSEFFDGNMDDLRVYIQVPSTAEVTTLFQSYPVRLIVTKKLGGVPNGAAGTITSDPTPDPNGCFPYGTQVTLTVVPNGGFGVTFWTDFLAAGAQLTLTPGELTVDITMDKNREIDVNFTGL